MMNTMRISDILAGLILALLLSVSGYAQAPNPAPAERDEHSAEKTEKGEASRLTVRELLTRAEDRADALRAKLFEVQMREVQLQLRLEDVNYRLTPPAIDWALSFVGSARPMDERREALRQRLESEKEGVNKLLDLTITSRTRLEVAIREADGEVERLRERLNAQ